MKRLLVPCLLAVLALGVPATAAAKRGPGHKPKPADQTAVAAKLVKGVTGAHTTKARAAALLKIMRAVHIQVTTPEGKPLSVSPEPGAARQYALYTFDMTALADAYHRGHTESLADVAGRLQGMGIGLNDTTPLPAALLRDAMARAAKAASTKARKHQPNTVLADIVRDLGRRHGYDITKTPRVASVRLDPVQAFLLESDFAVPYLRVLPAPHSKRARAAAAPVAQTAGLSDICQRLQNASDAVDDQLGQDNLDNHVSDWVGGGGKGWVAKQGLGFLRGQATGLVKRYLNATVGRAVPPWARQKIKTGASWAAKAAVILDGIQAVMLATSFKATALDTKLTTHWGHDGPGKQLVFRIKVEMLDDLGDVGAKCGKLIGGEIPKKGPVPKVPVVFEQQGTQLTPGDGTWDCSLICQKVTGADGIASVTFTPKVEKTLAGYGMQKTNTGNIDAIALPAQALNSSIISKVFQLAFVHIDGTRWEVTHHETPQLVLTYDHVGQYDASSQHSDQYGSGSSTTHKDWHLQASVPLTGSGLPDDFSGTGALGWLKATDSYHGVSTTNMPVGEAPPFVPCTEDEVSNVSKATGSTAKVPEATITHDKTGLHVQSLDFDPGAVSETYTSNDTTTSGPCPSGGTQTDTSTQFLNDFNYVHSREQVSGSGNLIRMTGWTPGTGNVLATKSYVTTDPAGGGTTTVYVDTFKILITYPAN